MSKAVEDDRAQRGGEYKEWYEEAMVASNEAGFSGMSAAETIRELSRAQRGVPDRKAFERRMLAFGWRNFEGGVRGDPPCWYYDNAELTYRWIGWREAMLSAAPTAPQAQPTAQAAMSEPVLADPAPELIGYVPLSAVEETPLEGYVPVYSTAHPQPKEQT